MNKQRRVLRAVLSGPCSVCECREWSGLQRIPCMPRERGDKIISRDPKWAVLWRCWKKPFSGAAANSVQVQIIYLDPRWKERKTFMSNQVGMRRRGPLFIGRIGPLFAGAHTRCTVSHFESLLFASWYSPVSEFKMAALCTSVILCGSAAPLSVEDFSGCVWSRWPVGRRSSAEMQTLFVAPLAGRGAELMHKMRPHSGDSVVRCCVTSTQAAFSCSAPALHTLFIATTRPSRCFCWPTPLCCGFTTCCPKDKLQTLSQGALRQPLIDQSTQHK